MNTKFWLTVFLSTLVCGCIKLDSNVEMAPKAPSDLTYTVTSEYLTLSWRDNSDNEMYFYIQRKNSFGEWTNKYLVDKDKTSFQISVFWEDSNLPEYRVVAYNTGGYSQPSNEVYIPSYSKAILWVYLCTNVFDGCNSTYFVLNSTCRQIIAPEPGEWNNTGFELSTNTQYALQTCQSCASDCSNANPFTTPKLFYKPKFYSEIYFYCHTPCNLPEKPE